MIVMLTLISAEKRRHVPAAPEVWKLAPEQPGTANLSMTRGSVGQDAS